MKTKGTYNSTPRGIARVVLVTSLASLSACVSSHPTKHGIPNFATVNAQSKIYRGAEPTTAEGWLYLKSLGVRTVVKLNTERESTDCVAIKNHLKVVPVPINQHQQFSVDPSLGPQIEKAVHHMSRGRVFVHCGSDARSQPVSVSALTDSRGGQDRTGLVVACYRVWVEHWNKPRATAEMKSFGFHSFLRGLAEYWEDNVK